MLKKTIALICLLFSSVAGAAAITEDSSIVEETKIVLLQANSDLGETQIGIVVSFIETTLGVKLNENAVKADKDIYRYKSNKWIAPVEQQLITDTLPVSYEVRVSFPIDAGNYNPRANKGNGGSSPKKMNKTTTKR